MRGIPRDVVADASTLPARNPRILIRDVVHSSNPRKVWAALAPADVIVTNKAPYLVFLNTPLIVQAYLLGVLGSATCDWFGHLRINLNLNFFIFNTIPIPLFDARDDRAARLATLAGRLALMSEGDYGEWVALGRPIEDPGERAESIAELDAIASLLYGLYDAQLELVFDRPTRSSVADVRRYREKWLAGDVV
ncbi:hypothetical protein GCM10025864_08740 [Luteimicrobium album]|uniref:Uncharacterized protein n=2 Tax=Luteimicrobium album TaxID=1054550 RepID=A0ABQ6I019_9MICO|nr:hypothetical protein GCM10025864_08740 [Luteimicrobium album]